MVEVGKVYHLNCDKYVTMNDMNYQIAEAGDQVMIEMILDDTTIGVIKIGDSLRQMFYVFPSELQ